MRLFIFINLDRHRERKSKIKKADEYFHNAFKLTVLCVSNSTLGMFPRGPVMMFPCSIWTKKAFIRTSNTISVCAHAYMRICINWGISLEISLLPLLRKGKICSGTFVRFS